MYECINIPLKYLVKYIHNIKLLVCSQSQDWLWAHQLLSIRFSSDWTRILIVDYNYSFFT